MDIRCNIYLKLWVIPARRLRYPPRSFPRSRSAAGMMGAEVSDRERRASTEPASCPLIARQRAGGTDINYVNYVNYCSPLHRGRPFHPCAVLPQQTPLPAGGGACARRGSDTRPTPTPARPRRPPGRDPRDPRPAPGLTCAAAATARRGAARRPRGGAAAGPRTATWRKDRGTPAPGPPGPEPPTRRASAQRAPATPRPGPRPAHRPRAIGRAPPRGPAPRIPLAAKVRARARGAGRAGERRGREGTTRGGSGGTDRRTERPQTESPD